MPATQNRVSAAAAVAPTTTRPREHVHTHNYAAPSMVPPHPIHQSNTWLGILVVSAIVGLVAYAFGSHSSSASVSPVQSPSVAEETTEPPKPPSFRDGKSYGANHITVTSSTASSVYVGDVHYHVPPGSTIGTVVPPPPTPAFGRLIPAPPAPEFDPVPVRPESE